MKGVSTCWSQLNWPLICPSTSPPPCPLSLPPLCLPIIKISWPETFKLGGNCTLNNRGAYGIKCLIRAEHPPHWTTTNKQRHLKTRGSIIVPCVTTRQRLGTPHKTKTKANDNECLTMHRLVPRWTICHPKCHVHSSIYLKTVMIKATHTKYVQQFCSFCLQKKYLDSLSFRSSEISLSVQA